MLRRVPSAGSIRWQRPSLPRVLGGEFPGFGGTMALCDSLGPWHHPSLPSRGATRRRVCRFAPSGPEHQTAGRGFVSRFPSPATYAWRPSGPPKFLENPRVPMPCSSTPAGPTHQATVQWSRRGPRYVHDEGSHDKLTFEAPSHGLGTRCLRFVLAIAGHDARLASRCWPALRDGIGYPQDSIERFQTKVILLSQACLAQGHS